MKPGKKQKLLFFGAIIVLLCFPLYFILQSEGRIADKENIYRFKPTRLVDPFDALRGNYLVINFPRNVEMDSINPPTGNTMYVTVEKDSLGYAHFAKGYGTAPKSSNYFAVKQRRRFTFSRSAFIEVPFNKYFINADNAKIAEQVYRREERNAANTNMYIEVFIKDGDSQLVNIYLDSIPLNEYINKLTPEQRKALEKD